MPPAVTIEMAKGFTLYMVMAIMSGRGPTGQKSSAGGEGPFPRSAAAGRRDLAFQGD